MLKPILVANWKNHPASLPEAKALLKNLSRDRGIYKKLSFFIAPPAPYIGEVSLRARSFANLALQDFPKVFKGTHTGVVSSDILKSFGAKLSIIGHSERRALGESSEEVAKKVKVALESGVSPLVCVGEHIQYQDGEHFEFLRGQIKLSLSGLSRNNSNKIAIAYEPVWAIGKTAKDALQPADLEQALIFIRKVLADMFGRQVALKIPILYGGSVEPANVEMLYQNTRIRGFLVGHASLNAKSLKEIANALKKKK